MKKKIKSLVTDDMFEEKTIDPIVNIFGNYRIIGNCEIVAINNYEKVKMTLYFNHCNKRFFLVKLYLSGKYHIDFFNHKSFNLEDLSDLESLNNEQISRCNKENTDSGLLYFSNYDNIFSVLVNGFQLRLRKV
jgi:hypothetical protein